MALPSTLSLQDLLTDIKQFLVSSDTSSSTNNQTRTFLLERITNALAEFEAQSHPTDSNEDFYDAPQSTEPYENAIDASVSLSEGDTNSELGVSVTLPPDAITASAMRTAAIKHGPLYRKERFIFVEQFRRCWAAVNANCLFLYSTDKENKPMAAYTLTEYVARASPHLVKHYKKKDLCFEIVSPGKKTYQFIARTQKDMEQWVTVINSEAGKRISNGDTDEGCKRIRQLPSPPSSDSETGDNIPEDDTCVSSESEVYEQMHSDEELYYNIEDLAIPTPQPPPKPAPPQLTEECQDEYDDVMSYQQKESYCNVTPPGTAEQPQPPPPRAIPSGQLPPPLRATSLGQPPPPPRATTTGLSVTQVCNEGEDLYDDVGTERQESFHSAVPSWKKNPPANVSKPNFAAKQNNFNTSPLKIGNLVSNTTQSSHVGKIAIQQKCDVNKPTLPLTSTKPLTQQISTLSSQIQNARKNIAPLKSTNILPSLKPVLPSQSSKPTIPSQSSKPNQQPPVPPHGKNSPRKINSGHIQGLIKMMEASMSGPGNGAQSSSSHANSSSTEELYEPVEQQDDITPKLPPRPA